MRRAVGYAILAAVLVAGCSTRNTDQVEIALTAAEKAAINYIKLPLCTPTNRPICSEKDISDKIKQADQAAYDAFKAWQKNPNSTTEAAVTSALAALSAAVPSLVGPVH